MPKSKRRLAPARNPRPDEIRAARERADLTQSAAAALVHTTDRVWRQWEAGDRQMHPAFWELFTRKIAGLLLERRPAVNANELERQNLN